MHKTSSNKVVVHGLVCFLACSSSSCEQLDGSGLDGSGKVAAHAEAGGTSHSVDPAVFRDRDLNSLLDFEQLEDVPSSAPEEYVELAARVPPRAYASENDGAPAEYKDPEQFVLSLLQTLRTPSALGVPEPYATQAGDLLERVSGAEDAENSSWAIALESGPTVQLLRDTGRHGMLTLLRKRFAHPGALAEVRPGWKIGTVTKTTSHLNDLLYEALLDAVLGVANDALQLAAGKDGQAWQVLLGKSGTGNTRTFRLRPFNAYRSLIEQLGWRGYTWAQPLAPGTGTSHRLYAELYAQLLLDRLRRKASILEEALLEDSSILLNEQAGITAISVTQVPLIVDQKLRDAFEASELSDTYQFHPAEHNEDTATVFYNLTRLSTRDYVWRSYQRLLERSAMQSTSAVYVSYAALETFIAETDSEFLESACGNIKDQQRQWMLSRVRERLDKDAPDLRNYLSARYYSAYDFKLEWAADTPWDELPEPWQHVPKDTAP